MTFHRVRERLNVGHRRRRSRNCWNRLFHFNFFRLRPWRFGRPALLLAVSLVTSFRTATAEALAASPTAEERVLGIEVVKSRGDDFVQYTLHLYILFKAGESKNGLLSPTA